MNIPGITNLACKDSVAETVARLESLLNASGFKNFCRIDQGEEARAIGVTMRPMVLLTFGDPKLAFPHIGAGGGTRTHTTFYGPRILSPVRLPFRHTGNRLFTSTYIYTTTNHLTLCH